MQKEKKPNYSEITPDAHLVFRWQLPLRRYKAFCTRRSIIYLMSDNVT